MRLRFVLRDKCYQDALIEMFSRSDQDIFVELGDSFVAERNTMIVTDIYEGDIPGEELRRCRNGLVLLTDEDEEYPTPDDGPFRLFKYKNIDRLLSDMRLFYFIWTGESHCEDFDCRTISVFCDSDETKSRVFATAIARQIAYRSGEAVLLMSLTHIDMRTEGCEDEDVFKRFMYYIEIERKFPREAFFVIDNYGVSSMRGSGGLNRLQLLSKDEFAKLVEYLAERCFDTIVFNVGTAMTDVGLRAINESGYRFFLRTDGFDTSMEDKLIGEILRDDKGGTVERIDVAFDAGMLEFKAEEYISGMLGEVGEEP